ncbi:exodeoxyribonuclease III [Candidatus Kaiserbacteria bacterium CG_4_9_14_3_um_filter_50_16]|uniref:Exodeoxyribonuclease III n=1 Tax=Candidatus Kaiserbacteria bacterium CG08_land_8_20_14_0_20_50_21 TaxID=1974604 RepID=A0A2H0YYJ3_9BACT|nr:MAG: exodeoxyribonuclease III [Parcubacteria group bacterium CG1_02_50_68]PIS43557.1 MAG: exodeoxyribonuclease III [Candidatus Kaiserbacteria bacterium CG08_land_8_20_14_0_20_50_21]PIU81959.1 MAG: exodeoxyribonuclease III [Candidatus Kaiserbacteria bacterium CG06_land_8_20_14_3_00_49_31]PIW96143.1 MAG: exodeoxyribonuclease III [Candidatus Kaiserbacteria bacterium CG_4_8_14_3_um_filter_50_23]PJA00813.1 MAG: exodeoxyribonuclease III [Candidatus Kaiserbacteria bacterium CG_4_10_14_0_2_um_filter
MRIISWNVNGLRSLAKNGYWESFLKGVKPDIFCLQETKASPEQLPEAILSPAGYSAFFSSCQVRKGYSGVALYSKVEPFKVIYGMGIKEFDQEGRFVGAEYDDFWLINAYFPNGGRGPERLDYKMRFYDAFLAFANKLCKQKPVIFCGDVNTAHEEIDLARPKENEENTGFLPEERAWIDEVVSAGYIDSFRHFHSHTKDAYTYWDIVTRARDRNVGWRLDYFFVANEYMKRIRKAEIHADIYGSDHCPISITTN